MQSFIEREKLQKKYYHKYFKVLNYKGEIEMKKFIIGLFILLLGSSLFAEAETYKIISIVGNVNYEAAPGKFEKVKVGQEFEPSIFLETKLNSSVDVEFKGKVITIKAKQKGNIDVLFVMNTPSRGGLKKQTIAKSDAMDTATGLREGVATASSRASEAKEDFTWEE